MEKFLACCSSIRLHAGTVHNKAGKSISKQACIGALERDVFHDSHTHTHKITSQEPYPEVFPLTSSSAVSLFLFLLACLSIPFSLAQVETLTKQTANNGGKLWRLICDEH